MRAKSSKQTSRWYTAPARLERNAEHLPQTSPDGAPLGVIVDRGGALRGFVSRAGANSDRAFGGATQSFKVWHAITGQGRVRVGELPGPRATRAARSATASNGGHGNENHHSTRPQLRARGAGSVQR